MIKRSASELSYSSWNRNNHLHHVTSQVRLTETSKAQLCNKKVEEIERVHLLQLVLEDWDLIVASA